MLTLVFKSKKEIILGVQDKQQLKLPLLGVTGEYLRSFYPLLIKSSDDKLPEAEDIFKAYTKFVHGVLGCGEDNTCQNEGSLYEQISKDTTLPGFSTDFMSEHMLTESDTALILEYLDLGPENVIDHSISIIDNIVHNNKAASLWLEFLALLCAVYFWLSPKYEKGNGGKIIRKKPKDIFIQLVTSDKIDRFEGESPGKVFNKITDALDAIVGHFGDDYFGKKVDLVYGDMIYEMVWPFDPPKLWELVTRIFLYRINNTSINLAQECEPLPASFNKFKEQIPYAQLVKMENRKILGIGYRAEFLLQIAWTEIFYFINNNIHANVCYICGNTFTYKKAYNKTKCDSHECKQRYEKEEYEKKKSKGIRINKGSTTIQEYKEYNRDRKKESESRKKKAISLFKEGKTVREIANILYPSKHSNSASNKIKLEQKIKKDEEKIQRWLEKNGQEVK